jgi:hypothetical protein
MGGVGGRLCRDRRRRRETIMRLPNFVSPTAADIVVSFVVAMAALTAAQVS